MYLLWVTTGHKQFDRCSVAVLHCPTVFTRSAVPQIIGGSLAARVGGRSVLLCAVLLWSLSTVITPLIAHSIFGLIVCRILLGLGEGLGE